MSRRDPLVAVRQMLDHAKEATGFSQGLSLDQLRSNRLLELAVVRLIEIIGEAANRVDEPTRSRFPGVPWREIVGTRNRIVHGYDEIDFDAVWAILTQDLPPLIDALQAGLAAGTGE